MSYGSKEEKYAYRNGYRAGKISSEYKLPEKYKKNKELKRLYQKGYRFALNKFQGQHDTLRAKRNAQESAKYKNSNPLDYDRLLKKYGENGAAEYIKSFAECRKKYGLSCVSVSKQNNNRPKKRKNEVKVNTSSDYSEPSVQTPHRLNNIIRAELSTNPIRIHIKRNQTTLDELKRLIIAGITKSHLDTALEKPTESKTQSTLFKSHQSISDRLTRNVDTQIPENTNNGKNFLIISRTKIQSNFEHFKQLILKGINKPYNLGRNGSIVEESFTDHLEKPSQLATENHNEPALLYSPSAKVGHANNVVLNAFKIHSDTVQYDSSPSKGDIHTEPPHQYSTNLKQSR